MKFKKGFTLLEVTVSILVMGLTSTALLNLLNWSSAKYSGIASAWKMRACFSDARLWLRNQITSLNEQSLSLKKINESIERPEGFYFSELVVTKHDSETFLIKISLFEDKNNNKKPDNEESASRLFCFRRRV